MALPERFQELQRQGYVVQELRHAGAILALDYPEVVDEVARALSDLRIQPGQIIEGGGGKSSITQSVETGLRRAAGRGAWAEKTVVIQTTVDGQVRPGAGDTHKIDHYRGFNDGRPG